MNNTGFVAGTLIHTDKGLVPIQELKVGDKVLSKGESGEGELIYKPVVRTIKSATKQKIISPVEGVYCTDNHPFWTHVYGEDKPRWVAARRITSNDIVDCLYPLVNYYGYKNEISGLYHESVRDPYQIGGNYLVATGHPNIALCMADFASKNDGPGEIAMRVIDFSSGEPLEVLTNDKDSGFDPVSHHSKVPDTSLSRSFWPGVYKFLDKENPEQRVEIKFYGQLVDDYIMPDWDADINATSNVYTDYVYNIEVADTHTYFIGEQAIWVYDGEFYNK